MTVKSTASGFVKGIDDGNGYMRVVLKGKNSDKAYDYFDVPDDIRAQFKHNPNLEYNRLLRGKWREKPAPWPPN